MGDHHHTHNVGGGAATRRALGITLALALVVVVVEIWGALISGSLSLGADAAHGLADVGGLALALGALALASRPPDARRTWGWARVEVLAAVCQAGILIVLTVGVLGLAVSTVLDPPRDGIGLGTSALAAAVALTANLLSAVLLGRTEDTGLSVRAARVEVLADAAGATLVLSISLAGALLALSGPSLRILDASGAVVIGLLVLMRSGRILRSGIEILLEHVPESVSLPELREHLAGIKGVVAVHDVHVSRIGSTLPVLSAHVVVASAAFIDGSVPPLLSALQDCARGHFDLEHSTFQIEPEAHEEPESALHH